MTLLEYRKAKGLTQEQCAHLLGLKSKSVISDIERGRAGRKVPLALALRIEKWSAGKVSAASLCSLAAELLPARKTRKAA